MISNARERAILSLLDESGLALPPRVIHTNLAREGVTFKQRTCYRTVNRLVEQGLAEQLSECVGRFVEVELPEKPAYYQITEKDHARLAEEPEHDVVEEVEEEG